MIEIVENKLDVETYLDIRASVHWKVLRKEQAEKALNNSLYTVMAVENGKTIGMGRIGSHLLYTGFRCASGVSGNQHRKENDGTADCPCGRAADGSVGDDALPDVCKGQGTVL